MSQLDLFAAFDGDALTVEHDGFTITAETEHDAHHGKPWEEEDGHGPVSGWVRRAKLPGELVLIDERSSRRFYDFAEACRIALRDGWGAAPHRLDYETGANGMVRANAQWFKGRELETFASDWCDDINAATGAAYAAHKASFPSPRAYAAAAARADYDRLRAWCNDNWHYLGVIVTVSRAGVELGSNSLWGIESDAGSYLAKVANDCAAQALEEAREAIPGMVAALQGAEA